MKQTVWKHKVADLCDKFATDLYFHGRNQV